MLLDTNICIYITKRKPASVRAKFLSLDSADVAISSITVAELEYGVYKSQQREKNQMALNEFLRFLTIVPYDKKAAKVYARVRRELEIKGQVISPMDTLIASHAISLGVTLVTNNVREFSRIPDLIWENWVD
jgi:tRNA(fMet)-specific endonuclease VapC